MEKISKTTTLEMEDATIEVSSTVSGPCKLIEIHTTVKKGTELLLTPKEVKQFIKALKENMK